MTKKIELQGVAVSFVASDGSDVRVLQSVDLSIATAETVCLIGVSGAGKTTLLRTINRMQEPTSGRVAIDGIDVRERDITSLRRAIGYVIQGGGIFPHLSVARNIGLLARLEGWEQGRIDARVLELLELVNLSPTAYLDRLPAELSGGERQRVGVARALVLDPDVVLMDEPFGALDPMTRRELRTEFRALADRMNKTIVMVTHDMEEAFALGDRVALLDHGKVAQIGSEAEFRDAPASDFVREFLRAQMPAWSRS